MESHSKWRRTVALFLIGQCITLFGSMLVHYAVMWHITLKTQSGVMMTLVAIAGALPMFFISPFGGVWADRYNKKNLINISDASIACVTLVMAIVFSAGYDGAALLLVCLVVRALGQGVQTPAVNALIPELVPEEHLTRINGISSGVQSLVMFTSPILGGALLTVAPIYIIMFVDVITAALGISMLAFFVKTPAREQKASENAGAGKQFHEIAQGLKYVSRHALLKKFLLLSALFNIMAAPMAILTPLQVARDWGDGVWNILGGMSFGAEQRLASVEVAFFIGMIIGGILIGAWGGFRNKSHTIALSTFSMGVGAAALGIVTNFWVYLACMGVIGVVMNLFNAPVMATLQTNVEAEYMGRVFSVLTMMSSLMMPLGMVLWGPLADAVAIDWLLIISGAVVFLMGFVFIFDKTLLDACKPRD